MTFIKKLFGKGEKKDVEPMRGAAPSQSGYAEQQVHADTRKRMEAELATARTRRDAPAAPPADSDQ